MKQNSEKGRRTPRMPQTPANGKRDYRRAEGRFLMVAGALAVFSFGVAVFTLTTDIGAQQITDRHMTDSLAINISDRPDGAVLLSDAASGETLWIYESGDGAFARSAMRALAFSRRAQGAGPEAPMLLERSDTGAVFLSDPVTEKSIPLSAFGDENAQQFAVIFEQTEASAQ